MQTRANQDRKAKSIGRPKKKTAAERAAGTSRPPKKAPANRQQLPRSDVEEVESGREVPHVDQRTKGMEGRQFPISEDDIRQMVQAGVREQLQSLREPDYGQVCCLERLASSFRHCGLLNFSRVRGCSCYYASEASYVAVASCPPLGRVCICM